MSVRSAHVLRLFALLVVIVALVGDGWSGRPGVLLHQVILLPFTCLFCAGLAALLFKGDAGEAEASGVGGRGVTLLLPFFEMLAGALAFYAAHHFARFGYYLPRGMISGLFALLTAGLFFMVLWRGATPGWLLAGAMAAWAAGVCVSVHYFPLAYLRSDMLPVIVWGDTQWLHHVSPYVRMHVGARVYDFPYLPGMLVVYLPFVFAGIDVRLGAAVYLAAAVLLIYGAARRERRRAVAIALGLFLLSPYLQYRHEIYLQPHWFTLAVSLLLAQRKHLRAAALVFGVSMAVYQFSWIAFPFFALFIWRARGWRRAAESVLAAVAGAGVVLAPFLRGYADEVGRNTVGQWGLLPHALADPMNLSFWVTYLVSPAHLLRLQAVVLVAMFVYCVVRGRCRTLADATRWMVLSMTAFVLLNVIVDGYFFLMLLFLLLLHLCIAQEWWLDGDWTVANEMVPADGA